MAKITANSGKICKNHWTTIIINTPNNRQHYDVYMYIISLYTFLHVSLDIIYKQNVNFFEEDLYLTI